MATHAHLMIDPMADGTPVLPAAFDDHNQITTVESRASYRKEKDEIVNGDVEEVARLEHNAEAPEGPTTGKYEEWAYYLYYNGDSGVGPNGYSSTLFQSFLNQAGRDSVTGGPCTDAEGVCRIKFAGDRPVSSAILIIQGISFAIMTLFFTSIGSCADYGNWNKWILIVATVTCWASQFGWMGITQASQWQSAIVVYLLGYISYGVTLVFYASIFPRLARNTAKTKETRAKLDRGEIAAEDYEQCEMLERNRLSTISTAHSNWGYIITLALNLSILIPLAGNALVNQYTLLLTNFYWILLGLPWFFLQKKRPGPPIPKGEHWLTLGWKQIFKALRQYKRLPYTFTYLGAFFLLADGLNTTGFVIGIVQNEHIQFSFLESTYLGLSQAATSTLSCYVFWYIQRHFKIQTKWMFGVTNVITVFIPLWGMLGLWTNKIGFHNTWEFWFYNVLFGLGQAPYYAYAQALMSDLCPPGYEGMFFGLYGIFNRVSSLVGPNICAAIIARTGNTWHAFIFLFINCVFACIIIWFFVDVKKGRAQAVAFSIQERGLTSEVRTDQVEAVKGDGEKVQA